MCFQLEDGGYSEGGNSSNVVLGPRSSDSQGVHPVLSSFKMQRWGTSLVAPWLRLHASNAGAVGLIPGRGTKSLRVVWCGQKNKISKIKCRDVFKLPRKHSFRFLKCTVFTHSP